MFRNRKIWLLTAFIVAAVLCGASYRARAEKSVNDAPAKPASQTAPVSPIPEPGIMLRGKEERFKGQRGEAVKSARMVLSNLPEAGEGGEEREEKEKDVKAPGREPAPPPMPDGWQHPLAGQAAKGKGGAANSSNSPISHIFAGVPAPAPTSSFMAVEQLSGFFPPDTHGAVGPGHVMTATNDRIRIQNRSGVVLRTVNIDGATGFWGPLGIPSPEAFDPRFHYDPYGQRWIAVSVAFAETANASVLVAASANSDPTGQWFQFRIDVDSMNTLWGDFPCVGFNANWITVSVNMFDNVNGNLVRPQIYAIEKAAVYAGSGAPHTVFNNLVASVVGTTIFPATTYNASEPTQYLVNRFNETNGSLRIHTISGPVGSPGFLATNLQPISPIPWAHFGGASGLDFAPQAGSAARIDNGDSRMQSVVFRNGSLWCAHTVFYPLGTSAARSAVQWWQFNPTTATIQQRGVIDDEGGNSFYAYPSLAVNANNDMLIGYSRFSRTQFASANYSFRAGGDPLNTLREDAILKAGEGFYYQANNSANRWGDYSATVVDPNDTDLWTVQQYALPPANTTLPGRWSSWWVRMRPDGSVSGPAAPPQTNPAPTPNPPAPSNDNFAAAQAINGCTGSVASQNYQATRETGEPSHAPSGNAGGKSIWFRWTAPATGQVEITTDGSNFDTLLGVYTGTSVSGLTAIAKNDDGPIGLTSRVVFTATSGVVYQIAVDGFLDGVADSGEIILNWSQQSAGCSPATTVQFNRAAYTTLESTGVAVLTLTRQGSLSGTTTVDYQTADGTATQKGDYTILSGTVTFASDQATQTFAIPITEDSYVESNETLTVNLSNPVGGSLGSNPSAVLTIANNDLPNSPTNPIDTSRFFVRQQYADFLSREPDQGGFDFWTGEIDGRCGFSNPSCISERRRAVSNAFFFELEYQQTGAYVYRLYRAAFGNAQPFPNPSGDMDSHPFCQANPQNCQFVRAAHIPSYSRFVNDRARVVGGVNLQQSQLALANAFVQRAEFTARYPASLATGAQFVDAVLATLTGIGADLSTQRAALISQYDGAGGGNAGRGQVMFRLSVDDAANPVNNSAFINSEYNRAFVATQYFGYLRRDSDMPGFNFWFGILARFPPRSVPSQLAMVCAFISSGEYQERFSPLITRNDSECPPAP
jgi:hypothetical protein